MIFHLILELRSDKCLMVWYNKICWSRVLRLLYLSSKLSAWCVHVLWSVCDVRERADGLPVVLSQVEASQGSGDDTAVNGIRLYCIDPRSKLQTTVESAVGRWAVGHTTDCIRELDRVSVTSSIEKNLLLKWSRFSRHFISLPLAARSSLVEVSGSHCSHGEQSGRVFFFLKPAAIFNVDHGVTLMWSSLQSMGHTHKQCREIKKGPVHTTPGRC